MANKKMTRRSFLKGVGAIGTTVAVSGFPAVLRGKEPDPIKVGGLYALSGPAALMGQTNRKGVVFGIEEINASGGIKSLGGAKLQLLDGDVQFKPEVAMAEAERLIREGSICLIGAMISSIVYATTQVAEKHRIPHLAVALADSITERGFKYTFRWEGKSDRIGHELVRNVLELAKLKNTSIKTAVILNENTLWGQSTAKGVNKWAPKLGAFEVLDTIFYPSATPNMTPEILKAKAMKPDILIPSSYPSDGILMVKTLHDQRFDVKAVIGGSSAGHSHAPVIKGLGKLADYLMNCVPHINFKKEKTSLLDKKFRAKFNQPLDFFAGHFYTGICLLADALERSQSRDPEALREALAKTDYKDHIETQSEPIRFDKDGDNWMAGSPIGQTLKGEYHVVYPLEFATSEATFPVPKWSERTL